MGRVPDILGAVAARKKRCEVLPLSVLLPRLEAQKNEANE